MADQLRGHSAAAQFSCELPGFKFDERALPAGDDVERLTVAADGNRLTVTVTTKAVGTPRRAESIAEAAAEGIWWGLQRELAVNVASATRLVRESIAYSSRDGACNAAASVEDTARVTDSASAVLGPAPATLEAAARHRRPPQSSAADLHRDVLAERDPVSQFTGLYNAVVTLAQSALRCESQVCTDAFILGIEPDTGLVPCAPPEKKKRAKHRHARGDRPAENETVYTALRNRLAHLSKRLAQGDWAATTAEVRSALPGLRSLVVRAHYREPGSGHAPT